MNRKLVILLVVILAILVVGGIGIGMWMMRKEKSSKSSRDLLIVSTDGGETYKIVEKGKESYESNHGENGQNGEESIRHVRTDKSILDQIRDAENFNDPSRCDDYECKQVNMRVSEDVFWFLQQMYQEVRNVSFAELRDNEELQILIEGYEIVKLNPITILYYYEDIQQNEEFVVGNKEGNIPLVLGYLMVLFTHKKEGKSLPRPDPNADYAVTIDL